YQYQDITQPTVFSSDVVMNVKHSALSAVAIGSGIGSFTRDGFVVKPGTNSIYVTLDTRQAITQSKETDNSKLKSFLPVTFKSAYTGDTKFSTPLAGTPNVHWYINNYLDLDPSDGNKLDYMGNTGDSAETYDNHNGMDLPGANGFATQYVGLPVKAAAGGVVIYVHDGEFDEQTSKNRYEPGPGGGNAVEIYHGNGWATEYFHMRKGSVAVKVGDYVSAGDILGMMASSGNSTGTHLHFDVLHNGQLVEPYVAPSTYWVNPLPYTKDASINLETYDKYHVTENAGFAKVHVGRDLFDSDTWKLTTTNLSAKSGSDFDGSSQTITFDVGQTNKWVYIPIINDNVHEGNEKFRITVTEVGGIGGPGQYSQ